MRIRIRRVSEGAAALCDQRYAVVSDTVPLGTKGLAYCTCMVLFPTGGPGISAVVHVENCGNVVVYRHCIEEALRRTLVYMKKQDGTGMSLVLLGGASAVALGAVPLLNIFMDQGVAESDILDLRRHGTVGTARIPDGDAPVPHAGCCIFSPQERVLDLFMMPSTPSNTKSVPPLLIQDYDGEVAVTTPGCCALL